MDYKFSEIITLLTTNESNIINNDLSIKGLNYTYFAEESTSSPSNNKINEEKKEGFITATIDC